VLAPQAAVQVKWLAAFVAKRLLSMPISEMIARALGSLTPGIELACSTAVRKGAMPASPPGRGDETGTLASPCSHFPVSARMTSPPAYPDTLTSPLTALELDPWRQSIR